MDKKVETKLVVAPVIGFRIGREDAEFYEAFNYQVGILRTTTSELARRAMMNGLATACDEIAKENDKHRKLVGRLQAPTLKTKETTLTRYRSQVQILHRAPSSGGHTTCFPSNTSSVVDGSEAANMGSVHEPEVLLDAGDESVQPLGQSNSPDGGSHNPGTAKPRRLHGSNWAGNSS